MKYHILLWLLLGGLGMSHAQLPRTSWPMMNGDPTRSSYASINLSLPLHIADTLIVDYRRENGMALWENKLYIADYANTSNRLIVTDMNTGDSLWSFDVPNTIGGMDFVPAVAEGVVLVGGQHGLGLYGLDALTGDSLWFLPVGGLYARPPSISDSLGYLCTYDSLICFNIHSGRIKWSNYGNTFQITPAVDEAHLYSAGYGSPNSLYALDKLTGDTQWINTAIPVGSFLSLSVDSQTLYAGFLTTIVAVNKATGEVEWDVALEEGQFLADFPGAFARTDDFLVVKFFETGLDSNQYLVLDKHTGEEINRFTGAYLGYGAPTVINDYIADYYGSNFYLYDLVTGEAAFTMSGIPVTTNTSQILAANDQIIIAARGPYVIILESNPTGVNDLGHHPPSLSIYPNPVRDELNLLVDLDMSSQLLVEILTQTGQVVSSRDFGSYTAGQHGLSMFTGDIGPGLYYLSMRTSVGVTTRKLIVPE